MKKLFSLLAILLLISSCETEKETTDTGSDGFDRKVLLENIADNIIIPAYQDLNVKLLDLKASTAQFTTTPNQANLETTRTAFFEAYKTWQYVEMFDVGKAQDLLYGFQMNIYPTNITDIQNNINAGSYDLTSVNNNDAVGFPAVEYLLYEVRATDSEIVSSYATMQSAGQKKYLNDLVTQMQALTSTILEDWTGSYRNTFVNSTDNTATSAVNLLANDFIFYYEKKLRANKIGIPAGVFSTTPLPNLVESRYNPTKSKELAQIAVQATIDFFNGKAYQGTTVGPSFASYVSFLRTNSGSSDLTTAINNQLRTAQEQLATLNNNFIEQINTDNTKMTLTYDALQRVVVLIKVDMLQTLNINVDFIDADGD